MASTNKTTNYNLSQYLANDKPTYLVDYNSDMYKIDTQMKANNDLATLAKSTADDNKSLIDGQAVQISSLDNAIGSLETTVQTHTSNITSINTNIGDLTNLNTTDKSSIVNAVNELKGNIGDLSDLDTTSQVSLVDAINEVNDKKDYYSTSEIVTNKIFNNKPVYRKVIHINALPNTSMLQYAHNISNIDDIIKFEGIGMTSNKSYYYNIPLNGTTYMFPTVHINMRINATNIEIDASDDRSSNSANIIVEYTKTTD